MSNALAIGKPGTSVATLAQDYAFGRDFVTAFRTALAPTGAKLVFEEYAPPATTDFTASYQRIFDALAKEQGRKIIFLNWAGGGNPMSALKALDPERLGISVSTGGNILPALAAYKDFPGLEGAAYYYYEIPKNAVNDWLVAENKKRFNGAPPDFFTCGGFIAAQAVVEALKKTNGSTDAEKLIATMEGMSFNSPKGQVTTSSPGSVGDADEDVAVVPGPAELAAAHVDLLARLSGQPQAEQALGGEVDGAHVAGQARGLDIRLDEVPLLRAARARRRRTRARRRGEAPR